MPAHLNRKQQREIKAVVERAKKDNGIPQTAQQSIPFQRMFPDGICRVTDNYYTKTIQYQDINYQLAQQEDKTAIFDEFVSWVINNCGNGWSVGRQTANGLKNLCDIIPPSEAKPGDLIFFQGTYNTSGASHVGIYVGNGMMIHCGDPISYASIETNYWQQHFYCFGRIP